MNRMDEAKKRYEEIRIPEELSERVMGEVRRAEERRKAAFRIRRGKAVRGGLAAAAAAAVVFTAALNTSTAFAESVSEIPVIGRVARVLTFRSYEDETEDYNISVSIPSVDMISNDLDGLEDQVNEEIHELCREYADGAVERAKEYRQAFLDTGGTEEEWAAHNIEIRVWYEVKSQTDRYLSLKILGTESWTSAYSETKYYNFDLGSGTLLTLSDALGSRSMEEAEEEIRRQMRERESEGGMEYWDEFEGISGETKFYINEAGNPVIVFDKYETAPGAAGEQEFEIEREEEGK